MPLLYWAVAGILCYFSDEETEAHREIRLVRKKGSGSRGGKGPPPLHPTTKQKPTLRSRQLTPTDQKYCFPSSTNRIQAGTHKLVTAHPRTSALSSIQLILIQSTGDGHSPYGLLVTSPSP